MQHITVFGAYGHTARFVLDELRRRGFAPILAGRDLDKLRAVAAGADVRAASVGDPGSLDRALGGAAAVINCAGPFAATVEPVVESALRAGIPYIDITGELEVATATFERYAAAPIAVLPAVGFFGALGDLLATVAMEDGADELSIAYALDSWRPTLGTRKAAQASRERRGGRRAVTSARGVELRSDAPAVLEWTFPAPIGPQSVTELATADGVAIWRHLKPRALHSYMAMAAMRDLIDAATPPPEPADERGRSSQTFLVEVRAGQRRAVASGRDIYAITGPLAVEAMTRLLASPGRVTGAVAVGAAFDARSFLDSLAPEHLTLEL